MEQPQRIAVWMRTAALAVSLLYWPVAQTAPASTETFSAEIHPPFLDQPGAITLPRGGLRPNELTVSVDVSKPEAESDCREECYVLSAHIDGADAHMAFRTSYGQFALYLTDFDGDHVEEVALVTGEGRGTSVRQEHLIVYRVTGGAFAQLLDTPISGYFGSGARWHYALQFEVESTGSRERKIIDMKLSYDHDQLDKKLASPELIPGNAHIRLTWDDTKNRFVDASKLILHP